MTRVMDLNRRGVELKQQGLFDGASECYQQAIDLQPDFAEAHFNLGLLHRDRGRLEQAVACLERTVALRPDVPAVWFELGQLYLEQRRWAEAEQLFLRLLPGKPAESDALVCLAIAWQEQGRLDEAAEAYQKLLACQPRHAVALTNLGNVRKSQGRLTEANECYESAIAASPGLAAAHANLGNLRLEMGQVTEAYAAYLLAAELEPNDPHSSINLGNALRRLERVSDALDAYRRALELDPDSLDAWLNISHLLKEVGDSARAREVTTELARRHPDNPVHRLRAAATCPLAFRHHDELVEYRTQLTSLLRELANADWRIELARWTVYAPECPYNLQFLDGNLRELKAGFAALYASQFKPQQQPSEWPPRRSKPRLGFVVTARHETAFLKLLGGVVDRLDPERWELLVLCSQLGAEKIRRGLRRNDLHVVAFPERFDHIVSTVRETRCDLLYYWEIGNDPTNYFLPFLRLAPVQVTSWGIQVTSGIPNVDAYLSSDLVEVDEADQHYTERLIRASTLLTYQVRVTLPPTPKSREVFGLSTSDHVYGCLQNVGKFHPDFDAVLADILRRDPQGLLVAVQDQNGHAAEILRARWQHSMPDVVERIRLFTPLKQSDYLSLLAACDVLLDPLHFGGVTTTYDALALHQPVVTLPTDFQRGRYTAACLRKIGVRETIAQDLGDYVKIAIDLASNADRRRAVRELLRVASQEAFADPVAIREHERIFTQLLEGRQ